MKAKNIKAALQRVLPYITVDRCAALLEELADETMTVVKEPSTGLMMMNIQEGTGAQFHLGEALITTAEVACDDRLTQGSIMGEEPEKALLLAVAEMVILRGCQDIIATICKAVAEWEIIADEAIHKEASLAASTRVSFESMTVENTDFGTIGQ
ncbi:MAG: phosphonate C-P lyase system protein PhnG [Verrucomicrobiota bacterium]